MKTLICNPQIDLFVSAMNRGIDAFEEAGTILVDLIDSEGPSVLEEIRERNPLINESVLEFFERVGRRQLYYKLGLCESPGTRALKRCPYSDQVKYFNDPLSLLTFDGDTLQVSVHGLTAEQAKQIIGPSRVRSLGEQRAYLESLKRKPQPLNKCAPYTVKNGKITFHEPCTLAVPELARLLAEASQ